MQINNFIKSTLKTAGWICTVLLTVLLIHNALQYFRYDTSYGILGESSMKNSPLYLILFYVHLLAGVICIGTPLFQFLIKVTKRSKCWHVIIGHLFVWSTLLIVVPTGLYLALFAKGGTITQVGFMVQGVLAGIFTYKGYLAARTKDIPSHINWMIRAYAAVSIVLSFRLLHVIFYHLALPYQTNYEASQWIGIMINMVIAELLIEWKNQKLNVKLKPLER